MTLSDDIRIALRPFAGYRELALRDEERPVLAALRKAAFLLLVLGAFVSFTAAGRLVAFHVASTVVFYSFLPALQAVACSLATRVVAPEKSRTRAVALYFDGHAPWLLFLLAISGLCLVPPDPGPVLLWLLSKGILPGALLATLGWGGVLTYACFSSGLGLGRRRGALATAIFYVVYFGSIVGYYLVQNQIQPQFPGIP